MQAELQKLNKTVGTINKRMKNFPGKGIGKRTKRTTKDIKGLNVGLFETAKTAQFAFGPLSGLAARITAFGALVKTTSLAVGLLTVAIAATSVALGFAVSRAIKFERAMLEVRKNAGLTTVSLKKLSKEVLEIAKNTGIAAVKIASIADQAGRLGIKGVENLTNFTRTIARLTVVTDLTEGSATTLARLLSVTGQGVGQIQKLGAVITALGSNIAASESEIVSFAQEIARATAIFDVSAESAAALGAAFAATGARPEATRTALLKTFNAIQEGLTGVETKADALVKVFNQPIEELRKLFDQDSAKFFSEFIKGLGRIRKEGTLIFPLLKQLGLGNVRVASVLQGAIKSSDFEKVFAIAREQQLLPTETIKQLRVFTSGTGQQIKQAGEAFSALAVAIGSELLPGVTLVAVAFGELAKFFTSFFSKVSITEESQEAIITGLNETLKALGLVKDVNRLTPSFFPQALRTKEEKFGLLGQATPKDVKAQIDSLIQDVIVGGPKGQKALEVLSLVIQARDELPELLKTAELTSKNFKSTTEFLKAVNLGIEEGLVTLEESKTVLKETNTIEKNFLIVLQQRRKDAKAATAKLRIIKLGTPQEKLRQQAKELIEKIQKTGEIQAENAEQIKIVRERLAIDLLAQAKKEITKNIQGRNKLQKRLQKRRDDAAKVTEKNLKDQLKRQEDKRRAAQARIAARVQIAQLIGDPERVKKAERIQGVALVRDLFQKFPKGFGQTTKEQQKNFTIAVKKFSSAVREFDQVAEEITRGLSSAFFELFRGSAAKDIVGNFFKKLQDVAARSVADFLADQTRTFFAEILVGIKKDLKAIFEDIGKILGNLFGKLPASFKEIGKTLAEGFVIGTLVGGGGKAGSAGGAIGAAAGKGIGTALGGETGGKIGKVIGAVAGALIGKALFGGAPKGFVSFGKAFDNVFVASIEGSKKAVGAARAAGNALVDIFTQLTSELDQLQSALDPFGDILAGAELTVKAGKKKPFRIRIGGKKKKFATIDEVAVALLNEAIGRGAFADASPVLQKILSSISTGSAIADIQAAVDFAEAFVSGFGELLPPLTDFGKEIKELKKTMDDARATAISFGLSIKTIDLAEQIKLQKKQVDFNKQIRLSILDIVDPLAAELERLKETQAERLKDAIEIGANLVAVEKLGLLERQKAIESFADSTSNVLQDFLISITASAQSKLPTQTSLANAQRRFSELRIDFLAGNVGLAGGLVEAAQNLLDLRRAFDASGPGFFQTQAFVESTIRQALGVEGPEGDPQLAVLQELNLDIKEGNQTLEEIRDILAGSSAGGGAVSDGGSAPVFFFGSGGGGGGGSQEGFSLSGTFRG